MSIRVLSAGVQTTVQAGPRTGMRHLGVPASGAADPLSLALANRLVGNAAYAAGLEATLIGPKLRFEHRTLFALTGAPATAKLGGQRVPAHTTIAARPGDELLFKPAEHGARIYIAVAGGIAATHVLGSVSTYLPAGLGGLDGRALENGDLLEIAAPRTGDVSLETPATFRPSVTGRVALRACVSVEHASLPATESDKLFDTNWVIGRRADRMGLALEGERIATGSDGRMPSAPVFPGTLQCPEGGTPLLLSVDAQTTGGYPRLLQVIRADRHMIGQLRPGDHVRLLPRTPAQATADLREKLALWRRWLPGVDSVI